MTRAEYRSSLKGRRCYVGLDLSSTKDLTAAVAVFPDAKGFDVLAEFFVPQDSIRERARRDRVPYEQWAKDGYLRATPGPVVDYDIVRGHLVAWSDEFDLRVIAYDPWNAIDIANRLEKEDGITCAKMRQVMSVLAAPTKSLEQAILSKRLRHDGHPVLRWCIGNIAIVTDDPGNLMISKKVSTERIDGAAALVMAVDLMDRNSVVVEPGYQMLVYGGRP